MKVNSMDKYQLTETMKKLKEHVTDPEVVFFDVPDEIMEPILNPPTDSEGYVHKYYFEDGTKLFIESLLKIMEMKE